jgi:hypothetical protein
MCTEGSASPNSFALADWEGAGTSVAGAPSVRECDAWTTTPLGIGGIVAPNLGVRTSDFKRIISEKASLCTGTGIEKCRETRQ